MNQTQFSKGDKVFAKMRGYPAWPARIEGLADETPNRIKYHVYFYGTSQIGIVNANDICLYVNNKSKFKRIKYKNFPKARVEIEQDMTPQELAELHAAQKRGVNKNIKKKVKSTQQPKLKEKTPQNTPTKKRKSDDKLEKHAKKSNTSTIVEISSSSTLPDFILPKFEEEKISSKEEETCPKPEKQESIVKLVKKQEKEVKKPAPITTSKELVIKLVKLNIDQYRSGLYQIENTTKINKKMIGEITEENYNLNELEESSVKVINQDRKLESEVSSTDESSQEETTYESEDSGEDPYDNDYFKVEQILGERIEDGYLEYRIRWKGCTEEYDSWEKASHLSCPEIVEKYQKSKKSAQTSSEFKNEEYYVISKIIDMKTSENGKKTFRIRWKGFSSIDDTWEPEENLKYNQIYQDFIAKKGKENKRQSD